MESAKIVLNAILSVLYTFSERSAKRHFTHRIYGPICLRVGGVGTGYRSKNAGEAAVGNTVMLLRLYFQIVNGLAMTCLSLVSKVTSLAVSLQQDQGGHSVIPYHYVVCPGLSSVVLVLV